MKRAKMLKNILSTYIHFVPCGRSSFYHPNQQLSVVGYDKLQGAFWEFCFYCQNKMATMHSYCHNGNNCV